jgi:hypothetical protein
MTSLLLIALPYAALVSGTTTGHDTTDVAEMARVDRLITVATETDDALLRRELALELYRSQVNDPRLAELLESVEAEAHGLQGNIAQKAAADALAFLVASPAFELGLDHYRVGSVFDGDFSDPLTRIHAADGAWTIDVSDELVGMARTLRTAVVAQELATHHGHTLAWELDIIESAAFLAGTAVYASSGGIGWSKYQAAALPGVEVSLEESSQWLNVTDYVLEDNAGALSTWLEANRVSVATDQPS